MKKIILAALSIAAFVTGNATVRIVNNNTGSPAQYTTIAAAMTAALNDDTIYIQGSPTPYAFPSITKRLVFIGAGYYVTGTQTNQVSMVGSINSISAGANGSVFLGLSMQGAFNGNNTALNDIVLERNWITGGVSIFGTNWLVRNNTLSGGANISATASNIIITNNLILSLLAGGSNITGTIVVNNNFFWGIDGYVSAFSNSQFNNNIFYKPSGVGSLFSTMNNCTFNNNILYGPSLGTTTLPPAGNSGNANINNTNPMLTNAPIPFVTANFHLYDFSVQAGSPALNAGTDNTNIGPSGGVSPMSIFNGVTTLPQIQELNLYNSTLSQGGQLNINFKARKHD